MAKKFKTILLSQRQNLEFKKIDNDLLINEHERISAFMKMQNKEGYSIFFAIPEFVENDLLWKTSAFTSDPTPLDRLSGDEYDKYKTKYTNIINDLNALIANINAKADDKTWASMLSGALMHDGEECVFCGEDKVVLANWSVVSHDRDSGNFKDKSFPSKYKPEKDSSEKEDSEITNDIRTEDDETIVPDIKDDNKVDDNEDIDNDTSTVDYDTEAYKVEDNTYKEPYWTAENTQHTQRSNFPPIDETHKYDESYNTGGVSGTNMGAGGTTGTTGTNSGTGGTNGVGGKGNRRKWLKYLLYLLLALLIGALIFFLLRSCSNNVAPIPGTPVMPEQPGVITPPMPEEIGPAPDSISSVVLDRLNILIEDDCDLNAFGLDFKKVYPDPSYSIIYFDTLIRRLQIRVPASEKENVKNDLPQKLSQYEFYIYDESVFSENRIPSDPGMSDSNRSWYLKAIKAFEGWDITMGSNNVTVAVIDDGFDINHVELKGDIVKPYNIINKSNNIKAKEHGTHVAGIAIAHTNSSGLCGIAPQCKFMPVQVSTDAGIITTTAVADAVLYAIHNGADVINLSVGKDIGPLVSLFPIGVQKDMINNMFKGEEKLWQRIFKIAEKHNCILVIASGNSNVLAGIDPMHRDPKGIKVSAIDKNFRKAGFSNYGDYSTISAPGVNIYSSVPNGKFEQMQGTSMAAPIVTGAVALMKSLDKNISAEEVIRILQKTGLSPVSGQIGKIIQLAPALAAVKKQDYKKPEPSSNPTPDCETIRKRIDSLSIEIERLRELCTEPRDTLKIPDLKKDKNSLNGKWKSTTDLHNFEGEKVMLIFDINGNSGEMMLIESNNICKAPISVSIDEKLKINQTADAICGDATRYYQYEFECKADKNGVAVCRAKSKSKVNVVEFNLIKIK